ncbi:MAG: PhzF family phenazine biosynthesis protein [Acetobacteraceae bacterium]|nr:PhzF family phenazine biosynthesis protein [Acetobacteraceae bacterium]
MPRGYRFVTVDVFTDTRFGGNPLAVFPEAAGLSDAEMQALAREFNLSETTFVLPPADPANTARVRIFTPATEMPFAGHPNVGTGWVLAREGRARDGVLRFEEIAGLVEVRVEGEACIVAAPQPLTLGGRFAPADIARCAGLAEADIVVARHAPMLAGVGNPFILAETTGDALTRAAPDLAALRAMAAGNGGRFAVYLYARGSAGVRARMFSAGLGVAEDPATGSAAAPLAALLLHLSGEASGTWDITQGVEMGRPSLLRTTAHRAPDGIRATVGGGCVPVFEGSVRL